MTKKANATYSKLLKIIEKRYQYLQNTKNQPLSNDEQNLITDAMDILNNDGIFINRNVIEQIWKAFRKRLIKNLREGHCKSSLLEMEFYWADTEEDFERLQIEALGTFGKLLQVYTSDGMDNKNFNVLVEKIFKDWIEY